MQNLIVDYLNALGHDVAPRGGTLPFSRGRGAKRRQHSVDLAALTGRLENLDEARNALAASAARGIGAVLSQPLQTGEDYSYIDVTSCLMPNLETQGFVEGVRAAGGDEPWVREWLPGLFFVYYIELDEGLRLLSTEQAERWSVHPERIEKAASSILFHRTGYRRWQREERCGVGVDVLRVGDGADAARAAILDLLDYERASDALLFAFPSTDELLLIDESSCSAADFREVVATEFERAELPFSDRVLCWRSGKLDSL